MQIQFFCGMGYVVFAVDKLVQGIYIIRSVGGIVILQCYQPGNAEVVDAELPLALFHHVWKGVGGKGIKPERAVSAVPLFQGNHRFPVCLMEVGEIVKFCTCSDFIEMIPYEI